MTAVHRRLRLPRRAAADPVSQAPSAVDSRATRRSPKAGLRRILTAGLLVITMSAAPAGAAARPAAPAPAAQSDGVGRTTWAVEPSDGEAPDGRVSFRHEVEPGAEAADHVVITNFSPHPATFEVHAGDGVVTSDGRFDLLAEDADSGAAGAEEGDPAATGPASWISLDGSAPGESVTVEIDADSSATVPFVIAPPADATPGDHPAGITATLRTDGDVMAFTTRVGARIHLRVAGEVVPGLAVHDVQVAYTPSWNPFAPGSTRLDYTIRNEGNVRIGAEQAVTVRGPFGWGALDGDAEAIREILPGQSVRSSVVVDGTWPLGRLTSDIEATPLVVGEDVVDADLTAASASSTVWGLPFAQLLLLLVLAGVVLWWRTARRRGHARTEARVEARVAEALAASHAGEPSGKTDGSASPEAGGPTAS
ncbi:hypothetical protein FHR81_004464 [Actinoalloteichus hoggarensis]|uniref:NPCBM-associated, NEW3 domain of alpha-galactosidase n=1 Tax=Actinoalloteichus hoggarensis TaxID=1470176 RepID=A0A221W3G4_9PSEU|nr:NEW3 domain-containing protein [Actinoalloteichus hoggarensis]ASO20355.1 NPCBM-associated, NEW3 domain of alpha-galactosidase [Actinoalloteichus hoggarensis]MBB5923393.1 hypothetical protein [Actinoalloteichus hoggarensis]